MKGVILSIAPGAVIVDLCHGVAAQDVVEAGFLLASSYSYFPPGTIHVAVVDPGVGTSRRILAIKAHSYVFLVPDNGLIASVVPDPKIADLIVSVENERYFLKPVSSTFHGRDVFAPVAAHIAKGVPLEAFGPAVDSFETGACPQVTEVVEESGAQRLEGTVVHVDHFGNLVTNIRLPPGRKVLEVRCGGQKISEFAGTYAAVPPGEALCLVGSSGFLEISVNQGHAASKLGVRKGENIHVLLRPRPK